eukprot:CAMPEP_0174957124 /NCGR_PEP_ID=MMETSP0004_2-20121128/1905_1 /TAXON_ID=420556 /ORGANISM="Ochromonas sp., Strain CCMP1393" /LENGTH=154 /DNA_ID=CAMNT_0016205213 /DNA_START=113 /DNA_END=573 /DNA_ORIENTATION=+
MALRSLSKRLDVAANLLRHVRRLIRRDPSQADKYERKKKMLKVCIVSVIGQMREILRITFPIPERRIKQERRTSPFGFIDNTLIAMCRPGGGPSTFGELAPRHDPSLLTASANLACSSSVQRNFCFGIFKHKVSSSPGNVPIGSSSSSSSSSSS